MDSQANLSSLRMGLRTTIESLEPRRHLSATPGTVYTIPFDDTNGDQQISLGEPLSITGITVYIDANNNGVLDSSDTKAGSNTFSTNVFQNLPAGQYTVRAQGVRTFNNISRVVSSPPVTMTVNDDGGGPTVYLPMPIDYGTIVGQTLDDLNGNGRPDSNEPMTPIFGRAYIDANNDGIYQSTEPVSTAYTNTSWAFTGVPAGTYTVRLLDDASRVPSPGTSFSATATVTVGQISGGIFFATNGFNDSAATVKAFAYNDLDQNGQKDDRDPYLTYGYVYADLNDNGVYEDGEPLAPFVSSGYELRLTAGQTYVLRFMGPDNMRLTTPARQVVTVPIGQKVVGIGFGTTTSAAVPTGVTGHAFVDTDSDGLLDHGETPQGGGAVRIDTNHNGIFEDDEPYGWINPDGTYLITGLTPGTYSIRPDGSVAHTVTISSNQLTTIDLPASPTPPETHYLSGTVQLPDMGPQIGDPVSGVTVWLDIDRDGVRDANEPFQVSDADGNFTFDNLPLGEFSLAITPLTGYDVRSGNPLREVLSAHYSHWSGERFIVAPATASLAGTAFNDTNGNGTRDGGESAQVQQTVFLDLNADGHLDADEPTTTTDENGAWSFSGLTARSYVVYQLPSAGSVQSTALINRTLTYGQVVTGLVIGKRPAPAWLSLSNDATTTLVNNVLTVTSGVTTLLGDAATTNSGLAIVASGTASVVFNTTQHLGGLWIANVARATVAAGSGKLLRVTGLFLDGLGRLDLNNNDLIDDYAGTTPIGSIRGFIASARAGGAWTGAGLTSSVAKNRPAHDTTLGYMEASDYKSIYGSAATFDGEAIDDTAVLVKYTLSGDADFSGSVNFNDFLRLQASFGQTNTTFAGANFDYNTATDFNDFLILQANFGNVLAASGVVTKTNAGTLPVILPPTPPTPPSPPTPVKTASISGMLFGDVNRNGKYDKGDLLAPGRTVWLDLDNDGVRDANEPSAVADAKGNFAFKNLAAGTYHVRRVFPKGYVESTPQQVITVKAGQAVDGVRIGSRAGK